MMDCFDLHSWRALLFFFLFFRYSTDFSVQFVSYVAEAFVVAAVFSVGAFDATSVSDLLLLLYWTLHVALQRLILLGSEAAVVVY